MCTLRIVVSRVLLHKIVKSYQMPELMHAFDALDAKFYASDTDTSLQNNTADNLPSQVSTIATIIDNNSPQSFNTETPPQIVREMF